MNNIIIIAQTVWLEMLRKKDLYIVLILLAFLTALLTAINAFGTKVPSSYILDIGLLMTFLLSITLSITLASRQFPSEIRSGTIFTMLTKPIGRLEFLLGKWLGSWGSLILANTLFYLIVAGVTLTRGLVFDPGTLFQVYLLHNALLGIIAAMALCFTLLLSHGAGSTLTYISIMLTYLFLPRIPHLMIHESGWRAKCMLLLYYAAPHLELFDMRARVLHNWGPLQPGILAGTIAYGLLITAGFLTLSWLIFKNKRFQRGSLV
jgi:ABC-type transport system involved in multi-copper enzyme maturation permease subunit